MRACVADILKYLSDSVDSTPQLNKDEIYATYKNKVGVEKQLSYFIDYKKNNDESDDIFDPCLSHSLAKSQIFWYTSDFISSLDSTPWTKEEDSLLIEEVQKQLMENETTNSLNSMNDSNCSNNMNYNRRNTAIDWTKFVDKFKNPDRSPMELLTRYRHSLDPQINREPWTLEEECKLYNLAVEYHGHTWAVIAEKLNTHRTPLSCLKYYQRFMNTTLLNEQLWAPAEDALLAAAVAKYGSRNWSMVSGQVPGRSIDQCKTRFKLISPA